MKKSKLKWYAIWIPYCILLTPLYCVLFVIRCINMLADEIVRHIEKFKWYIVGKYKPW